jgi:rare lipoprotein A
MKLGIANPGSALVEVERVFARDAARLAGRDTAAPAAAPTPAATVATPLRGIEPPAPVSPAAAPPEPPPRAAEAAAPPVTRESTGIYVQLGAFASADNAEGFRARLARDLAWLPEPVQVAPTGGLHRVRVGPYKTREEAQAVAERIRASLDLSPVISPAIR